MTTRIGIAGIAGRMGRLLAEETLAAGATLAGGIDSPGTTLPNTAGTFADLAALAAASDVVVEFTHASTTLPHAAAMAAAGRAWLIGTTGLNAEQEAAVAHAAKTIPVMYAPNYSPGVVLTMVLAERMAAALPAETYDAEIVEMHHRQKVDAPSGTAVGIGRAVAAGRGVKLEDVTESGRDGHTGARKTGAIGFAALRGGQIVGEHSLIFTAAGEQITLSHRAMDRRAFATGAIRAALWVAHKPPGLYDMRDVLGMR
jgi:4-hydroxy-tetrahydrodipicolinate reductase